MHNNILLINICQYIFSDISSNFDNFCHYCSKKALRISRQNSWELHQSFVSSINRTINSDLHKKQIK
jgi:hypothetical protein